MLSSALRPRAGSGNQAGRNDRAAPIPAAAAATLPPADIRRWVTRRKAEVVAAVRHGTISLEEACTRYKLSIEEFLSWQNLVERHGQDGLRATKLQNYRDIGE